MRQENSGVSITVSLLRAAAGSIGDDPEYLGRLIEIVHWHEHEGRGDAAQMKAEIASLTDEFSTKSRKIGFI